MTTAELTKTKPAPFTIAPITFEVQLEKIAELRDEYMPLAILDVNNKSEVAAVHDARMNCVKLRRSIEKRGKELRDDANKYAKQVISAERALTDAIAPIEAHLENEEGKVKREQERLAREAEEKRVAMVRERLSLLQACGKSYLPSDIDDLPADEFAQLLAAEQADKKKRDDEAAAAEVERDRIAEQQRVEAKRLAEERVAFEKQKHEQEMAAAEARRKEEETRAAVLKRMQELSEEDPLTLLAYDDVAAMSPGDFRAKMAELRERKKKRDDEIEAQRKAREAERAALDKQREEQAAAQAKIDAEKKRLADEEAERQHQAALEKAKAEAAEKARLDAIAEQERQAAEAKAKAEAEELELKRLEAKRPDREKLLSVVAAIHCIVVPDVSDDSKAAADQIRDALRYAARDVQGICDEMIATK